MDKRTEVLGLVSGALTTSSFLPQVVAVWRMAPKPAADISMLMYGILLVGIVGWIVYGFRIKSWPVKIWNVLSLLLALAVFSYKLIYG
ncbi:MAG: hypothetical protein A2128_01140 [Candidatus Liptonbacteria bacterium GWC1_60_9]|uniref:Uncharacterized protein n=3 Tax=Candidatus Liptoniibacteriota TaxID=1817909 RepID=A0A1G2CL05_9BACT|nr:MAG: hypothetical protein UZ00_C0013G0004 [Parcubacteria group bacterium GW2011_GWA1_60_11]OGY96847.1 MAG: hypothetical protein A2128_01140 [Candidatus Liptonbacteria bacterium GWC1_60_9]OGY98827.1 MAG: hypothetical protein A3E09_01385 [Candidatus Liptonbacteria bacterium RIFCSPHIGHO2_12_FULL_60_13]OGZ02065.1 MAG: hypothetical protein A3G64_02730 [Candidatus Liptonbacteria bacterium RIFCSPLOWO2_12_FULL_60_15]